MNHGLKIRISKRSQEIHSYQITTLYPLVPDLLDPVKIEQLTVNP